MFEKRFKDRLLIQRKTGLYRSPVSIERREGKYLVINGRRVVNFSSNDYLGLGASETLRKKVAKNFAAYGSSSSSSRLVSGNYSLITEAEKKYAGYFGYESALFFPSGFQANVGLLSTLFEKGDTLIFDKHIHASSVKGMTLSGATFLGYNHNSMSHLEKRLKSNTGKQAAVVTESLFSMDGDFLDREGLKALKKKYGFACIVDEAHALGVVDSGERHGGDGIARNVADIAIGTFGKALGLFGAFILLSETIKDYLMNFCSALIYSTTLPAAHASSAMDVLDLIAESDDKRMHLHQISHTMKEALRREGAEVKGDAHILAIEIGDENKAVYIANAMCDNGVFVFPARYPTVPAGKAILRIGMTALHEEADVTAFIAAFKKARDE